MPSLHHPISPSKDSYPSFFLKEFKKKLKKNKSNLGEIMGRRPLSIFEVFSI
jgi:hypothetical protein